MKKKPEFKSALLDALRADPDRTTTEQVVNFHGVPIYGFISIPKNVMGDPPFKPRCYGWVKKYT